MVVLRNHFRTLVATAFFSVAGAAGTGATAEELPKLSGVELADLDGHKHRLGGRSDSRLSVLVFVGTECPVSNGYAPSLNRLHAAHRATEVLMIGVHSDPDVDAKAARAHAKDYELLFPIALDRDQQLAEACGVLKVPTAVVIAPDGKLLYRGRIDNRYERSGVRRPQATVFDLSSALGAALAGRQPAPATTEVFGCPLPSPVRRK